MSRINMASADIARRFAVQTSERLGVALPAPVAAAIQRASNPLAIPATPGVQEVADAVAAAVADGRDPFSDPAVVRLAVGRVVGQLNVGAQSKSAAGTAVARAVAECADEFIESWKAPVARAGETLAECRAVLGAIDLREPHTVSSGATGSAWGQAQDTARLLEQVRQAWNLLAASVGLRVNARRTVLVIAEPTIDQWRQLGQKVTAWDVVGAGLPISLATTDEYRSRSKAIDAAVAAEDEAARIEAGAGALL